MLAVHVEAVRTPTPPTQAADEAIAPPAAPVLRSDSTTARGSDDRTSIDGTPRSPADYQRGPKATTSLALGVELKSRAETAVLRTSPLPGGARSLTGLINEAVARELIRLADELNDGIPFEPNRGAFRMGRPFGS
jgi:hypothetical protein